MDSTRSAAASRSPAVPPNGGDDISLRHYAVLVGAGAFATTFAQLRTLANYPLTFLLKEHYALRQERRTRI
jgi:hypothetical protein